MSVAEEPTRLVRIGEKRCARCQDDSQPDRWEKVLLHRPRSDGSQVAGVDPCLADLVRALNHDGFQTVGSCCGHGRRPASIILEARPGCGWEDDLEMVILPRSESAEKLDHLWPPIWPKEGGGRDDG